MFTKAGQFDRYIRGYWAAMAAPNAAERQRVVDGLDEDVREDVRRLVAASRTFDDVQPMSAERLAQIKAENRAKRARRVAGEVLKKRDPLGVLDRVPEEIREAVRGHVLRALEARERGKRGEENRKP